MVDLTPLRGRNMVLSPPEWVRCLPATGCTASLYYLSDLLDSPARDAPAKAPSTSGGQIDLTLSIHIVSSP
jgi:hypothetical protein